MAKLLHRVDGQVTNDFDIGPSGLSIGRSAHSDVQVDDLAVSAEHARLVWEADQCVIEDRDSTNGTFVNGERVQRQVLAPGDVIRIGWNEFQLAERREAVTDKTARVKKTWIPGVYVTKKDP